MRFSLDSDEDYDEDEEDEEEAEGQDVGSNTSGDEDTDLLGTVAVVFNGQIISLRWIEMTRP